MERTNASETFNTPFTSGSSWMQITFTLDIGRYRTLRDLADAERLTVPGLVREIVMDALKAPRREASLTVSLLD